MGADLYRRDLSDPLREKFDPLFRAACQKRDELQAKGDTVGADAAQKEVEKHYSAMFSEGYFRDSYNEEVMHGATR